MKTDVSLLRQTKRKFFRNLGEKKLMDNTIWKEIQTYFWNKGNISNKVLLRRMKLQGKTQMLLNF